MKIRNGFVSNSSSSSFVVGYIQDPLLSKALQAVNESLVVSIKEVARAMLEASDRKDHIRWLDKLPEDIKFICFNSCNYETEIMQLENCITVCTCNNEQTEWEEALEVISTKYNVDYRYMEDTNTWEDLVRGNPYYDYTNILFSEIGEEYETSFHYNIAEIAKHYGPAAYINDQGAVLYEKETRVCIQ